MAFNSVERIMRDVNYGWLIRYMHMNGASMFFIAVYIHIFRGLYYGSYKAPRELLWILGVVILLLMMATAFMGYVLPWGQMSFWGATVITNLFSAIPLVGDSIVTWLWGGFAVDNPTLNRFFSLHYLLPFVIVARRGPARRGRCTCGSNNPLGIDLKGPQDTLPFHPYYTVKDGFGLGVFLIIYAAVRVLRAELPGRPGQLHPGQPAGDAGAHRAGMVLPAVLRDPARHPGQAGRRARRCSARSRCCSSLPWLDTSPVRSASFRPIYKWFFWLLVVDASCWACVGANPPEGWFVPLARIATIYYFFHFLVLLPLLARLERPVRCRPASANPF